MRNEAFVFLYNLWVITNNLRLDKNYLLLRVEKDGRLRKESEEVKVEFIIFNFSTAEGTVFNSKDEMLAKAKELGFIGKSELMTLPEYNDLFWE